MKSIKAKISNDSWHSTLVNWLQLYWDSELSLPPRADPGIVTQRLGFLCHSTPNWWAPSCAEGPMSKGEEKNS